MSINPNTTSIEENSQQESGVLSAPVTKTILQVIVLVRLPVNVIGIVTNLINIRVFWKQGVRHDSSNIAFFSLSVFDLMTSLSIFPYNICYVYSYAITDIPQFQTCITMSVQLIHAYVIFQLASSWTTVYMSVMRTLCVLIPLKVKLLFTPNISILTIAILFSVFATEHVIYAGFTKVVWIFSSVYNTTLAYTKDSPMGQRYLFYNTIVTNQALPVLAVVTVSITTSLMMYKLTQVQKWRLRNASGTFHESKTGDKPSSSENKSPSLTSKDVELLKAVTTVTGIYFVCTLMSYIPGLTNLLLPGVSHSGINNNLMRVVFQSRFLFDSINASINFFFYIRISTRYKDAFAVAFPICSRK